MNSSRQERRLIVYIGPAKTGSTTLQNWLGKRVNSVQNRAFSNWTYPRIKGMNNWLWAWFKGTEGQKKLILEEFSSLAHSRQNVIVASEALAKQDTGMPSELHKMMDFQSAPPEIVIHYRSPRKSHLVSLWKQDTQAGYKDTRGMSFRDWMCDFRPKFMSKGNVNHHLNPLGLAWAFVDPNSRHRLKTYLVDMSGVQDAKMDIGHAFSCQVLRVDCTLSYLQIDDGQASGNHNSIYGQQWVKGLEGDVIKEANQRSGLPELSEYQLAALDELLTQRDCAFYSDLVNNSWLTVLYRHNLWTNDCSDVLGSAEKYNKGLLWRNNASALLEQMRQVVGCRPPSNATIIAPEASELDARTESTARNSVSLADARQMAAVCWVILLILVFRHKRSRRSHGADHHD